MFYTIYKITNIIDHKVYIGKHQTNDLNDSYMGSGKQLKRAQAKHGIKNFKKEILFQFDNEDEMNSKEAELVTEEFCLREDTYNLCPGGKGGWGYVNASEIKCSKEYKRKHREAMAKTDNFKNRVLSENGRKKLSEQSKNKKTFLGKTHTTESKEKISASMANKLVGEKNSQFGTMWITDGQENKKINKTTTIPTGWYRGRTTLV